MRSALAGALLILLQASAPALAAERYLTIGRFTEHGRGIAGHGRLLARSVAAELARSGAFHLLAGEEVAKEIAEGIRATHRPAVDERHAVEVGKAAGASDLLLGEVHRAGNTCSAFVQLVHLESRETRVTRPEHYDCTARDLGALAGDLAEQLTGRRASPRTSRQQRLERERPVQIRVYGREAEIDGERYTLYEGAGPEVEARPAAAGAATSDPQEADAQTRRREGRSEPRPGGLALPGAGLEGPNESEVRTESDRVGPSLPGSGLEDRAIGRPEIPSAPPSTLPTAVYGLARFALDLQAHTSLAASVLLALPILLTLLGALLLRLSRSAAASLTRLAVALLSAVVALELGALLLYRYFLERSISDDFELLFLAAAPLALALTVVGARFNGLLAEVQLLERIGWMLPATVLWSAVLLAGLELEVHVSWLAAAALVPWVALKLIVRARRRARRLQRRGSPRGRINAADRRWPI